MAGWRPFCIRSMFALVLLLALVGCGGGQDTGETKSSAGPAAERGSAEERTGERTSRPQRTREETVRAAISAYEETTVSGGTTTGGETVGSQEKTAPESTSGERTSGREAETGPVVSDTLVAGAVDRTGGPLVEKRMVSYYGHPFAGAMGVLGQLEPEAMVAQLKEQAQAYTRIDPERPAVPTIELIASVAQPEPGPDGLYLTRTPTDVIEQYSKLAEENGCLLLLDVQIGYSTIADEIEVLRPFLERGHVHLAIDPEYDMYPGEIPGQQFGSSTGEEIMGAARTLSELVEKKDLPTKVLVVHQFRYDMIINKEVIEPVPNVQTVIHADGFGTPEQKIEKYNALVRDQPIQYGGFKLFYDQDYPLLSPKQVLRVLEPNPAVISYQ
jgi:hypothetical protein